MALGNLIPLVILFVIVGGGAFIGYQLYVWSNELADRANKSLEKKNVAFTSGGLRVGVAPVGDETYSDKTQNVLVNVWNHASLPNYRSRLGWNSTQQASTKAPRQSASNNASRRASPPQQQANLASQPPAALSPPRVKSSRKQPGSSPVPGGWN